jgi:hypothetical protein
LAQNAIQDDSAPAPAPQTIQKSDELWQPILPPTSSDGADALDRRIYSQMANDEFYLAHKPSASKSYAVLPHAALTGYYDDNITLSHTQRQSDFALVLEPGVAVGFGDIVTQKNNFLIADYTGRLTAYMDHSSADAFEQFASVRAQLALAKLTLNTNFSFLDLDDVDMDSGARTSRRIFDTVQMASYEISGKDFIEVRGQNVVREYQVGPGSVEWQGRALYNYRWDPKLTLGGGFAAGVLDTDASTGQTYEQALLRVLYDPTAKISVQAQGGVEVRQLGGAVGDSVTPVMDLTCTYRPMLGTSVNLNAYTRTTNSSASGNLDYTATGVDLSVAKELGVSWKAILKGGYENNSYFYTNVQAGSPREDNFFYLNPSIQLRVTEHVKLEIFYNYRDNASNNSERAFTDNQVGLRASFTY